LKNGPVHIFTTHFYTALEKNGPKQATLWTAKKNIDVFMNKCIYIPVNMLGHWSLCCVVNPGAILKKLKANSKEVPGDDELYPCILFFDSLMNMHPKDEIAQNVRMWLDSEWNRLKKWSTDNERDPFETFALEVHQPKGE
jgi:Ulp1 family protease